MGGTEETTTGVIRLRALEAQGGSLPDRRGERRRLSTSSTTATGPARAPSTGSSGRPTSCSPAATGRQGLRLERPRRGHAGAWDGRAGDRHRGRAGARARSAHGRLPVLPMEGRPRWATSSARSPGDKNVICRGAIERMKDGAILRTGAISTSRSRSRRCVSSPSATPRRDRGRGVRVRGRPADLPDRRGPPDQPRGRRGPPRCRDGHELRQPGPSAEYWPRGRRARAGGLVVPLEINGEIARSS